VKRRGYLVVVGVAILLLTAYCAIFCGWKWHAIERSKMYGLEGYYFYWPPVKDNARRETCARMLFYPLLRFDEYVLGSEGPAPPPLESLSD